MSQNFAKFTSILTAAAISAGAVFAPLAARAAETVPASGVVGNWVVSNLAVEQDGWTVEAYKTDRALVAWVETNPNFVQRRLYVFDGQATRLVANIDKADWNDVGDSGFYDPIAGSFDAADGLVVWVMSDGHDREIWSWNGAETKRVSDNSYDDKHPVVSRGIVVWTSQPGTVYNLMARDTATGVRRKLDSWHVFNYAFSGQNLYWLNRRANENWFRVFRYDNKNVEAVGEGDDRPIREYFLTDGKGSAAWEYSTKKWDYDKRMIYVSYLGARAIGVLQRDVPPNITYLEDFDDGRVAVNVTDLLTSFVSDTSLIIVNASGQKTIDRQPVVTKTRFVTDGLVRHQNPDTGSVLLYNGFAGGQDMLTLERVRFGIFDADGDIVAGAIIGGDLLTRIDGQNQIIDTAAEVRDLKVRRDTVAWLEGTAGRSALKCATRAVLVRDRSGVKTVAGGLVKAAGAPQVYLAASDGQRYLFNTEASYLGWYADFRAVRTVPVSVISAMPLAGNVLYKPGYRLIRASGSAKVYAVGAGAKLHWLANQEVAYQTCGADWSKKIDVLPDSLIADYPVGEPVTDPFRYTLAMAQ